jgi:hypothetical protein
MSNPYFQLFDLVDRDVENDKELIAEFVEMASKHYIKKGVDKEDALNKIKYNIRVLSEEITTKVVRMVNDEDVPVSRAGRLLKATEVGQILNISRQHVYNLLNKGIIKETSHKGAGRMVNSVDLDDYMNNN